MKLGTTELILSSVLTIEAKEKTPELGVPEQILSSVSTIETNEKTPELAITEQVLSSVSKTETTEKTPELGVPEQIPSDVSTIEAKERTPELGITQQIPSDVSTIEAKERTPELGITRQIPSSGSAIEGKGGEKHGIKAGKLMNRNLAFLLISVLAIGIVILGVLQGQKSGNLDELSSELDNSRQTITELQTQLTVSQQDVKGLTDQLTQAQQKIEELQGEINALQTPLTPSEPFVYSGEMLGGDQISIPIELKQFERVEGKITGGLNGLAVYVKDAGGTIVKDFGRILQSNIMFTAQTSGIFKFVIKEPSGLPSKYNFQYTIYQFQ
jgi:uncharacterized coiled-coil protein SlyX